jgi:RNA polymerase sigma-70 factor (ECF subfamily)
MEASRARLQRLLDPVHDRAVAFARSVCRSTSDGDDLFQESIMRAIDKIDALREDGAFKVWLYRIIVSLHRSRYRRAFWRRLLPLTGDLEAEAPSAEESLGAASRARLALAELPHDQREAIVLFEIEEWKVEEIAELHAVSVSAIKSRLARGRERLRTIYARRFGVALAPTPTLIPGETR